MTLPSSLPESSAIAEQKRPWSPYWIVTGLIVLALGTGLAYLTSGRSVDADRVWAEGQASLRAGQIPRARAAVNRLARLRAPTPLDFMFLGLVELAEGHDDAAIEALAAVPDHHPAGPRARLLTGQIELRRNRARSAESYLLEAVRLEPSLAQAHRELIYIYGFQLQRPKLTEQFEALSRIAELSFDNVFHWCLLRTAQWDPASAIDKLTLFIEADPDDRHSRLALAENFRRSGLFEEAESVLAPIPIDDVDALAIRVMVLFDRHQEDEGERLLNSASPDLPALAKLRGRMALAHRDGTAAVHHFRVAHTIDPSSREAVFGLISALTLIDDDKTAEPLRQIARRIDELSTLMERVAIPEGRTSLEVLRGLGAACAALGRIPEARAWYKQALAIEPLDVTSQQALFRLQSRERSEAASQTSPTGQG